MELELEEQYYVALEEMSSARNTLEDAINWVKNVHRQLIQERDKRISQLEKQLHELRGQYSE